MRNATCKDLGITWVYWLIVIGFFAVGCFFASATQDESEKDKGSIVAGCTIVFGIAICGALWPILRTRERQGILMEQIHSGNTIYDAILFPASRVKHFIGLFGCLILGGGVTGLLSFTNISDDFENKAKGVLAAVVYAVFLGIFIRESFSKRHGVLLLPDGILWRQMARAPYFIPWEIIKFAGVFAKPQEYGKPHPCFGLSVTDCDLVKTSKGARKKMTQKMWGVHLHFEAETLLVPLPIIAEVITLYSDHPELRAEIGTSAAIERIEKLDLEAEAIEMLAKR